MEENEMWKKKFKNITEYINNLERYSKLISTKEFQEQQRLKQIEYDNKLNKIKETVLPCICGHKPKLITNTVCMGMGEYVDEMYYACEECGITNTEHGNPYKNEVEKVQDAVDVWNNMMRKINK